MGLVVKSPRLKPGMQLTLSEELNDLCSSSNLSGRACGVCLLCESATTLDYFLQRPLDEVVLETVHRQVGEELDHALGWRRNHPVKMAWSYILYAMKQQESDFKQLRRHKRTAVNRVRKLERQLGIRRTD